ncbi:hypothetical protein CHS0354_009691 [Potamilus streckersoni]|uniref:Uncharacterized protein n=1 Tax=Potamilus streckersoni TaxID=2493646 RepID=A0AAE0VN68_9BIVA|nr:hypothetical protein CHS0354_009691 [Potamilus streckersoni]
MTDNMKQREEDLQHKLIEATKKVDHLSRALQHSTEMLSSLHKFVIGDKKYFNQPLPEKAENDANANLVDFKNRLQEIARHHTNDLQLISYAEKLMKELRHYIVDYGKGEFNLPEEKGAIPDGRIGVFRTSAKDIAAEVNRIHEHLKELQNELLTIEQQLGNSTPKQPKEKKSKISSKS